MKFCVALALVCVASAVAPPRISLDLAGSTVKKSRDFAETCPAGLTGVDRKLCPFPKASAWDHHDQQVKVTTIIKCVDGCAERNMVVKKPNMMKRSSYLFTYDAVDGAGNKAEQITFALVLNDKIAPKIDMCGARAEKVQASSDWKLCSGSLAVDNLDGVITRKIRYTVQKVDGRSTTLCEKCHYTAAAATIKTTSVGEYLVTLSVSDNAGFYGKGGKSNKASPATKAILIRDTVAPKCKITGGKRVVECGSTYKDSGAVCKDSLDGKVKTSVVSDVEENVVGRYTVTYTAMDKAGNNAASKTRNVVVKDTKKPIITLRGDKVVVHHVSDGKKFTDDGVKMSDQCPGKLTLRKSWSPPFSAHTVGTYRRTYTVTDRAGLVSRAVRIYKVVDDVKPIITVTGRDSLTLEASNSKVYDDKGATCADTSSTKAIKVEVTGDVVALTTPGSYKVIYNCEDLHGNAAVTRTRTIVVRDTIAPKLKLVGGDEKIEAGFKYTDKGAKAWDNLNRKLTSKITRKIFFNKKQVERVDTRKTGTYRIVYSVKDRSGNKATRMTRLVTVIDTLAPVITLQLKSQVHTRRNNKKGINGVKNPANNSPFQHRLKALDFHGGKEQNKF
jgi:hypothetical protein